MAKDKGDKRKDNVTPLPKIPKEKHKWKCKECGMSGKVATEEDAEMALLFHYAHNH